MSDQDTKSVLANEIGSALEPVALAFQSPQSFSALMERLGWDFNAIPAALNSLKAPAESLSAILRDGEVNDSEVPQLLAAVTGFIAATNAVASQPTGSFPTGLDVAAFKNEFPRQLIDYLLVDYLSRRQGGWAHLLKLAGVLRLEDVAASGSRLAFTRRTIAWEDLVKFFSDPTLVLRNAYHWGQPDFRDAALIGNTADVLDGWHIAYRFADLDPAMLSNLMAGATNPDNIYPDALQIPLFEQNISGFGGDVGIELLILPQTAADLPGFAILPYSHGNFEKEIPVSDDVFVKAKSEADLAGGVAIIVRPNRSPDIAVGLSGGAPASASVSIALGIIWRRPAGNKIILLGSPDASNLQAESVGFEIGGRADSAGHKDLYLETTWSEAAIVIKPAPDEADSFLASLLPSDGIRADLNFTLGISTSQGVYFSGSGGLEISLPTHIQLGPIEIESALLSVRPTSDPVPTLPITLGATIKGDLGPLQGVVENIGLSANFTFPHNNDGNLGPADLHLSFKPPNGVGLSLDAGIVKGGGYLYIDTDRGQYAGALELVFGDFLSLHAIGLIDTKMPDGSKGFSLLIIVTADFGAGIQLGFGFTLLAVGGLLGLNRTMLFQPLMDGVRTDSIESMMFPHDIIANAQRIISDLRAIFPPQDGTFLIGPMAKLGWGEPTLVSLSLGVIIEIPPGDIAILGILKLALPAEELAVLVIQVNFIGALEFDKKRLYFFASLFDSHILFITIDGEMGVLFAYGDDGNFVLSVGGFHPQFNPPPLPFPTPHRIQVNIINESYARIRCDGYFAVTTNTVQFGSHSEYYFGFSALSVQGHSGFDALIQFSPFHFIAEISTSFSVNVFDLGVYSIDIDLKLEGPTPWHAHGTASLSFLFFSIGIGIDFTWGDSRDTTLPPISVMPILSAEFAKQSNWRAILPSGSNLLVSLRKLDASEAGFVLHPVGTLQVSQRAIPLDLTLDKVGNQKPTDANRFSLGVTSVGLEKKDNVLDLFAPSQFKNFDDAAKLSQAAYQKQDSGIELSAAGNAYASATAITREVRYHLTIIDTTLQRRPFYKFLGSLFSHFLGGASVTRNAFSANGKSQMQPFADKVAVASETFAVAHQSDNTAYSPETSAFASQASANDYLAREVARDPTLAGSLHVLPQFELAA